MEACATNIEIALSPIIALGMTALAGWGIVASCATVVRVRRGSPVPWHSCGCGDRRFVQGGRKGVVGTWP
jgi:hypothetical protein